MSAKEPNEHPTPDDGAGHDHDDHGHDHADGDNYERAYSTDTTVEAGVPTPEHGFWRSMRELEGQAQFQTDHSNNEFPAGLVADGTNTPVNPLHRRNFFQLMGASMALAGVGACRYEKEEIVPLARRPEDQVPGAAMMYATAAELGGAGHALLATSFEGRPIKLDGNPDHPFASGGIVTGTKSHAGIHPLVQASILNCYDPDRSQTVTNKGAGSSLENFRANLAPIRASLSKARVLSEATSSPTIHKLREELTANYPGFQWHEYEPISHDNSRAGTKQAFGTPLRPIPQLAAAETIVTIDADIFFDHPAAMKLSRDWALSRRVNGSLNGGKMSRMYSIESAYTNTGAMADHRLGVRSELGLPIAMAIDAAFNGGTAPAAEILNEAKIKKFVAELIIELKAGVAAGGGKAVVIAGRKQGADVHAVVARINEALGAPGKTLTYVEDLWPERTTHLANITTLANDIKSGAVQTLIILGGNPVYDAPADLDFATLLAKVPNSVHLHDYVNETSQKSQWHIPRAHFLEVWGDTLTWDGIATIAQPLIAPLFGGISSADLLAIIADSPLTGEALVKAQHTSGEGSWRKKVHDGFTDQQVLKIVTDAKVTSFSVGQLTASQLAGSKRSNNQLEITFQASTQTYDGRFANNAWLQETPDFMTKATWDNYALVGPETAEVLGLKNDTKIKVKVAGREITIPCYTMPGQARYSIALVLGYGRTAAGRVGGKGTTTVGVDVYKLRTSAGFGYATDGTATATGERYDIATVQEHWDIRQGIKPSVQQEGIAQRLPELIVQATNAELLANKEWKAVEGPEQYWDDENFDTGAKKRHQSLFQEHEYNGHKWGMAIDLTTCTGCNSCMVACQSENNVPVVGRTEVMNNREMHWIRIDRYFSGSPEEPQVVHQPVGCQQCENAPCEQVCPVGATSHSDEGLNDMAYNRCIGTRYCANNCPYKVRKFNFLDWNKEWRDARNKVRRLLFNPEVTVRMRGVMEKCTFCVQRIQNAKIHARAEIRNGTRAGDIHKPVVDGEISTACQAACPTEAIVFGDLADANSRVSRLHADRRSYELLAELYTKPRNHFLARIRNPNPDLEPEKPKAAAAGEH